MARGKIAEAARQGRILISDGAWGTLLQARGLKPGACPELWCAEHYEDVKAIAESYFAAGSDMVETNSFGGTKYKLGQFGLAGRVSELNEAAARASREAAGEDRWAIASMGPTGKMLVTGEVTEEELYEAFREQAAALERGGADAVCVETMTDIGEALQAVRAAKENTGLEVICTFSFETTKRGYRTIMGATPEQAAQAALAAGADIVGANCGNGTEQMAGIAAEIRAACPDTPILIQANAGMPELVHGEVVFPEKPGETASFIAAILEAGANIVGGCCGTTPEHIKAIRRAVNAYIHNRNIFGK